MPARYERIHRETVSGLRWDRPELHLLLDRLREGDVLVAWKLNRLSPGAPVLLDDYADNEVMNASC